MISRIIGFAVFLVSVTVLLWMTRRNEDLRKSQGGGAIDPVKETESAEKFATADQPRLAASTRIPFVDRNPGYVGPAACRECHAARVDEFVQTSHFRTCRIPVAAELPSSFSSSSGKNVSRAPFPGIRFEMTSRNGGFFQETISELPAGEQRRSSTIDLVFGAGSADDVYLHWDENERLHELPVAWLWTENRWGSSHFCTEHGRGDFSREMTVRCMECHTTWLQHEPGTVNMYRRQSIIPGVTCERCHGPARDHIDWHQHNKSASEPHAIIRPATLDRERLIETCTQCHSNAVTFRQPPFSYRPGTPLADAWRTLSIEHPEDDHVANQIEGLRQSACFTRSDSMTCVTCHDPHHSRSADEDRSASCAQCHTPSHCQEQPRLPGEVRGDCVGCHMPQRIKMNVKFRTETDDFVPPTKRFQHRIAIHDEARDEVVLRWLRSSPENGARDEAERLTQRLSAHWLKRAEQFQNEHQYLAAIGAVREAITISDIESHRERLKTLVAIQAKLYALWSEALAHIAAGRLDDAKRRLEDLLWIRPNDAETHVKLGTIFAIAGQRDSAIRYLNRAIELDDDNASGWGVLGRMEFLQGNFTDAIRFWNKAREIEPRNAQIDFDLGVAHLRLKQPGVAIPFLERAAEIDPVRSDIVMQLVTILLETGQREQLAEIAKNSVRAMRTAGVGESAIPLLLLELAGEDVLPVQDSR